MTCSKCFQKTTGGPAVLVYVTYDGDCQGELRFTGIVWHLDCVPAEYEHLRSECRAVTPEPGAGDE